MCSEKCLQDKLTTMEISVREYIIKEINGFPKANSIAMDYLVKKTTGSHVILVRPSSLLEEDKEYNEWEYCFWNNFSDKYPDETLLFTDEIEKEECFLVYGYNKNFNEGFVEKRPMTLAEDTSEYMAEY